MALQWVEVGSLKGSKGDQGPQGPAGTAGRSMRAATQDIAPDSDVSVSVIHPSDNIQTGDLIMDTAGELYQVTSVADGSVHVGAAVTGVNLRGPQGEQGPKGDPGDAGASDAGQVSYTPSDGEPTTVKAALDGISQQIADMNYERIAVNSLTVTPSTAETGSTVDTVDLAWTLSKTAKTLTLTPNGEGVGKDSRNAHLTGLKLTQDTTWTVKATDERDATAQRSVTLDFMNGVYHGVGTVNATGVDNAFILGLTRTLRGSNLTSFTDNAGSGEYIYYAAPSTYATPTFNVGGFDGGFTLIKTLDFTNASGHTESYRVWRSDNPSLGATTVTIK